MHRIPPEFKIVIPEDQIAQHLAADRAHSRLLVVDRQRGTVVHLGVFSDITDFIAGDLVVLNETRVIPARVEGCRPGGGKAEVLFLPDDSVNKSDNSLLEVRALINPPRRLHPGMRLTLPGSAALTLLARSEVGGWNCVWSMDKSEIRNPKSEIEEINHEDTKNTEQNTVFRTPHSAFPVCTPPSPPCERWGKFHTPSSATTSFPHWLEHFGLPPLPPYIKRPPEPADCERYQTVYARQPGSLAAPTAGLHFTPELLAQMERRGCDIVKLTLDVGLGTFQPILADNLAEHQMANERYNIPPETAKKINQAKSERRRTMVGTTVVRTLESAASGGEVVAGEGVASLFIYPPYQFKIVDRLLTNFHRPDSTLLQLVAALIGWDLVSEAYRAAVDAGFRFYSYGDAMLVL